MQAVSPVQAVLRLLGGDVTSPGPELIIFPWMLQMIVSFLGEEKAVIQRMRTSLIGIISILFLKRELLGVGWLNAWVSWCLFSQREAVSFTDGCPEECETCPVKSAVQSCALGLDKRP